MTTPSGPAPIWLALGAAIVLAPAPATGPVRLRALAAVGGSAPIVPS